MLHEYKYLAHIFNVKRSKLRTTQSPHHLPVHGNDVSNEGAFLHWRDMSVGYTIRQRGFRAAGHYSTGTPVGDEDGLAGWTLITCAAIGDWGDVCQWRRWRWLKAAPSRRRGEKVDAPVSVGELTDVGEPGTGISKAHRKPFTDSLTFWLSWGKF